MEWMFIVEVFMILNLAELEVPALNFDKTRS